MAASVLNSVEIFGNSEGTCDTNKVQLILNKLEKQQRKLHLLQQDLLKERQEKEGLQSDFEHLLQQLQTLKNCHIC